MGAQDASKVIRGQEGLPQLTKVWCVDAEAYTRLHAAMFAERKPSPALRNTPTPPPVGTLRPRSVDLTPLGLRHTQYSSFF
jgi:hypothetical protein